jgi:serine O-acetyltransferase
MNLRLFISLIKSDMIRLVKPNQKVSYLLLLNPRLYPAMLIRIARYIYLKPIFSPLAHIFTWLNVIIFGLECTPKADIGRGLLIPHSNGIVIGAIKIGDYAVIFQGVTLGSKSFDLNFSSKSRPIIGNGVTIGAGAKVLGGISIGDNSIVGANAVVLKNVNKNQLVVGIPANTIKNI